MASIDFSVTMTDGTKMEKSAAVADADVARLLTAFAQRYPAPEGATPDGPWLVGKWIEETVVMAMNYVKEREASAAAAAAAANVELIAFTIT